MEKSTPKVGSSEPIAHKKRPVEVMGTHSTLLNDSHVDKSIDFEVLDIASKLENSRIADDLPSGLVDNISDLAIVLDTIVDLPTTPPSLFIDLEGTNLSRLGSISILQIYVGPKDRTYLIDIEVLQMQAFKTPGSKGQCLKDILELAIVPKVFYDVRNDSDALYSHFNIRLAGIQDLQLMELATRTYSRRYVKGLGKCIELDLSLSMLEKNRWKLSKEQGLRLFAPERGGTYEVFKVRPLPDAIAKYCMQDVQYLPTLWELYKSRLSPSWSIKVDRASKERVRESQSASYIGHGPQKALGPW